MKTLIINPPSETGFDRSGRWPAKAVGGTMIEPIFLAYAAAILEKENLPVELIDCRPFYISQEKLLEKINENVGLAVLQTSTVSIKQDLDTARAIKERSPKTKILLVGSHVSVLDKETLQENLFIDFIARGEYDYTILDVAKSLNQEAADFSDIPGITFRQENEIIKNPNRPLIENLDELPYPARHFLPMNAYFEPIFKSKNTYRLVGSRGCPFQCTFCLWVQTMYGRKMRSRSPKNIVDEIEVLIKDFGAKGIYFEDDTFTLIPERAIAICDEILKRKIKIPWSCMGRVDTINEEMLKKMKQAGCYTIRFGIESASQEILNRCKKGTTIEQIKTAFELTKKSGIEFHAAYTFGLPGETKETTEQTIKFATELGSDYAQFAIAMPFPGTEFFNQAEKNGWLKTYNWTEYEATQNSVIEYPNLTGKEIVEAAKKAYRKFYFRPSYMLKRLLKIRSLNELIQSIKGAANLIKRLFFTRTKQSKNSVKLHSGEKIECPICHSQKTVELLETSDRLKISKENFSVRKCLDCEIMFTFPILNWQETEMLYSGVNFWKKEYKDKNKIVELLKKAEGKYLEFVFKHEAKRLLKFTGQGKVLDVGCSTGLRLEAFGKQGFRQYYGIEPLKKEADYAKEIKKLPVQNSSLSEFNCPENSFDIITFYGVFEHLNDPLYHLKIVSKLLKPGGWLVIQTPNFDSWQAKLFKNKWSGLSVPYHYFHYTPRSISNLLAKNGFIVRTIDWKSNFIRPLFWGFSFLKSGPKSDPQFIWEKEAKGEKTIFYRIWWIFLILLSLIPTEIENIFGKGGHMTIYATNQKNNN